MLSRFKEVCCKTVNRVQCDSLLLMSNWFIEVTVLTYISAPGMKEWIVSVVVNSHKYNDVEIVYSSLCAVAFYRIELHCWSS